MSEGGYYQIVLSRPDSSHAWGFRLEGGVDTQSLLLIQKVTPHSLSERAGLRANDVVRQFNGQDAGHLTHEQAKMEIIRSGNDLGLTVQRGVQNLAQPHYVPPAPLHTQPPQPFHQQGVWRPSVQAVSPPVQAAAPAYDDVPLVTRTSLVATNRQPAQRPIGTTHNAVPQPFSAAMHSTGGLVAQTGDGRTKRIVHSQFNSPKGLYSQSNAERTFNDTYQHVDSTSSGISSLSTGGGGSGNDGYAPQSPVSNFGGYGFGGGDPHASPASPTGGASSGAGSMYCGACNEMIKGVFVKVQNKIPMHPACLKCVKCGVGLRNIGYFYLDGQLFCETHAKQVARPPDSGLKPMAVYK